MVVGEFHKRDIEAILADSPGVRIVQPSSIGKPGEADVRRNDRREYRLAIAGFNLLGVQSTTGNIDHAFVGETLQSLKADADAPEIRLLETRLDVLQGHITPAAAVERYHAVATEAGDAPFTWTGVTDAARIDSYFDPFGNLTVRQRALLEAARELQRNGEDDAAAAIRHELGSALGKRKKAQLAAYWDRYVPKETAAEAK